MKRENLTTRKRILGAALRVFSRKGFFETRVDDIARAAGVAKGTIYLYFKEKPAIYIAAIDNHFRDGMAFLSRMEARGVGARRKLEDIAVNLLEHTKRFGSSFPGIMMENIDVAGRVRVGLRLVIASHLRDVTRLIARIVKEGIRNREFRRVDPEVAAIHFLNVVRTAAVASVIFHRSSDDRRLAFDIFFRGIEKRR